MTVIEKNIMDSYITLLDKLSEEAKLELIEKIKESIQSKEKKKREKKFWESFGSFESNLSAEELAADIRASRKFRDRNIEL